jgi:trk system potassium uptake protein TrkH
MDFFDALCHAFTAISTAGFSTRNDSVGAFGTYSQVVLIVSMLLGGTSFSLHYFALRGDVRKYWASGELRWYLAYLTGVILIVVAVNWPDYDNPLLNLRDSAFDVTSILTTTGFATADYERWPVLAQGLLFAGMFVGACAGSTSGGLKQVRLVLLLKHALLQTRRLVHPRQVEVLKLDRHPISKEIMEGVLGFTVLFFGVFIIAALLLNAAGVDLVTAGSGVIACLSTVGPGLGEVGPLDNYASQPYFAKIVLCVVMLMGRLEIFTVLVLFSVTFWKK